MTETLMEPVKIDRRVRAIVMFGPAHSMAGTRPAEYFQCVVDPDMVSPGGDYIRFGQYQGDELVGWQRVDAMTVCEILGEHKAGPNSAEGYEQKDGSTVTLRMVRK